MTRVTAAACGLLLLVLPGVAFAQRDLSGEWSGRYHEDQEHRIPGPALGDYTGLPINDAGRLKADSWDASILSLREHQAKPHPSTYSLRGPANIRIRKEVDPVTQELVAYELFGTFGQATRTIWLDGRAHPPPFAPHTWAGFSTGAWQGEMLTVYTTHFKVGWIQRNGVAHSDQATMTEHFMRHGDVLTVVTVVDDPIYLEEPFMRSTNWVLNPTQELSRSQFDVVDEIAGQAKGYVPHYLPGSPGAGLKLSEFSSKHHLPAEAARGGAATTYPEYQLTLQRLMSSPDGPRAVQAPRHHAARPPAEGTAEAGAGAIQLVPVQGNVYMLVGAGGNIAVQIGDEGVLLVDTGSAGVTDNVIAAIRRVTDKPIRLIIDTHLDPDHTGGNADIAKIGKWLGGNAPGNSGLGVAGARVIAHEHVLTRISAPTGRQAPLPFAAWPTETFFGAAKEIFFNNEAIQLLHHRPQRRRRHRFPAIGCGQRRNSSSPRAALVDAASGGSIRVTLDGLNRIIGSPFPRTGRGGTYVIPGTQDHGGPTSSIPRHGAIVRDRVQDRCGSLTLAQVKAANRRSTTTDDTVRRRAFIGRSTEYEPLVS